MNRIRKIGVCTVGGALVGLALGLCPRLGIFSELRNFQIFLLEMSYQSLTRVLPAKAMRALGTAWGELSILGAIGALIGLGIGVLFYVIAARFSQRWVRSSLALSVSATVGVFVVLFGILWCRIVLVHSSTHRMVSPEGLGMVLGSVAIGCLAGFGALLLLGWLARSQLMRLTLSGLFLVLLVGYLASTSVGGTIPAAPRGARLPKINQVIVLGADGATWDVALPMMKAGQLPNLARLQEQGTRGDIRATLPWKSPILWTSIATGKRKEQHGILDFVIRGRGAGEVKNATSLTNRAVVPVSLTARKVKAIWDIASEAGLRVNVVNWYASWPAEPLNGTMVSNRFLHKELPDRIFPPTRTSEIDAYAKAREEAGVPRRIGWMAPEVGFYLLEQDQPQLHLLYLREIDDAQHFFWKSYAARRGSLFARWLYGPADPSALDEESSRVEEAYKQLDGVLGRLMELTGPQTTIIVVSDHGGGIKSLGEVRFTLDPVLEQWGLLRYLPDGKTLDWTATTVYDATKRPWYEQRELFLNQRPEGPFSQSLSKAAQRELLESVIERLKQLRTSSGKPLVTKAWIREPPDEALHAVVQMNLRLDEQDTVHGQNLQLPLSRVFWRTTLTGTHRLHGLLVMAGPGIKSGYRIRAASILDITPTVLYLLGLPVADDMEGRVLLEAVEPAVRTARPVQMVATYETGSTRAALPTTGSTTDEELLEELRSLGYIQ